MNDDRIMTRPAARPAASPPIEVSRGVAAGAVLLVCLTVSALLWTSTGPGIVDPVEHHVVTVHGSASPGVSASQGESTSSSPVSTSGHGLGRGLDLTPRTVQGQAAGYVVGPRALPDVLSATRLREGDVLTAVDGSPLGPARMPTLADELAGLDRAEINFERDGRARKRTIILIPTVQSPASSS